MDPGSKGLQKSFAPPKTPFCTRCKSSFGWCKSLFGDLCSLGPKDLLHPPLSTFGNFPVSVNFPGPQLPNESSLFPVHPEGTRAPRNYEKYFSGNYFVMISCQREKLYRGGPKGVSTKGVSMKRPNFPYFRAFYAVVSKGNFQESP